MNTTLSWQERGDCADHQTITPSGLCRFLHSDHRLPGRLGRTGRHNPEFGIMHPAALLAGCRPHLAERLPEPERAIGETDQFLLAFRRCADDDQDALRLFLEPGLQMDAVGPAIDVALG